MDSSDDEQLVVVKSKKKVIDSDASDNDVSPAKAAVSDFNQKQHNFSSKICNLLGVGQ